MNETKQQAIWTNIEELHEFTAFLVGSFSRYVKEIAYEHNELQNNHELKFVIEQDNYDVAKMSAILTTTRAILATRHNVHVTGLTPIFEGENKDIPHTLVLILTKE